MNHSDFEAENRESSSEEEGNLGAKISWDDPESPLAPYFLSASQVCAVLLLTFGFAFYSLVPLWHTDFWGHLAFGQWMLANRQLPEREPFSPFSDPDKPYINFQWVTQLGYALVFEAGKQMSSGSDVQRTAGGVELIRFFHALMVLLLLILLMKAYRNRGDSLPLACAGVLIYLVLGLGGLSKVRPQIVGQLCFVCLLLCFSRPRVSQRTMFLVPILFVFWANAHGSFMVGLALLLVWFVGQRIEVASKEGFSVGSRFWRDADARRFFFAILLSVLGISLLNPHGPKLYFEAFALSRNPNVHTLSEWQPLHFSFGPGGHWVYSVSILLLVLTRIFSQRPFTWAEFALIVTFGVFPLHQQRMYLWWQLLLPWLLLPSWKAFGETVSWKWLHFTSSRTLTKTVAAAVPVLLCFVIFTPLGRLIRRQPPSMAANVSKGTPWTIALQLQSPATSKFSWEPRLAKALQRHYPNGEFSGRVFASETFGDYLNWALPSTTRPVVYTHVHLFTEEHWRDCMAVKFAQPNWPELLDRWGVNLVLVEPTVHRDLVVELVEDPAWLVVLAEGEEEKSNPDTRMFLALRIRRGNS